MKPTALIVDDDHAIRAALAYGLGAHGFAVIQAADGSAALVTVRTTPELSRGGTQPIELPSGELRTFLQDGDEVILRARACRAGFSPVGFGECRGTVQPAPRLPQW